MLLLIAVLGVFAALATITYLVLAPAGDRASSRASLRHLDEYAVGPQRDEELHDPFGTRVVAPVLGRLVGLGRRLTPTGYVAQARRKLTIAGKPTAEDVDRFLAVRVLTIAAVPVVLFVILVLLNMTDRLGLAAAGLLSLMLVLGPDAVLNRQMAERQHAMRLKLPDILDLLAISVEAGLGFEQALDRTVSAVPGPLSDEFNRMLGEARVGATRATALQALDERTDVPELHAFVLAILQADTFGVSIAHVLRLQADELRVKRRQLAQEQAQKVPVKMLFPMVFCIFPALFVVVIGPAVINLRDVLS